MPNYRTGQLSEVRALVKRYHYSGTMPNRCRVVATDHAPGGLFGDFGEAVAACCIGVTSTKWSEPIGELKRLVRVPAYTLPLTGLIAFACKVAHKHYSYDLLVSFADSGEGHHGGVYQAASWRYHGKREPQNDGLVINGRFYAGRTCNSTWGTRSVTKLRELHPELEIEPHFDEGKHLYWRALSKSGKRKAARLGLQDLPYPKPNKG